MADIILHHYPGSHFSEKIRRILAYKKVPWHSVEQPIMMPKPELQQLTGGYRRAPVMQIGADIYCDTTCIARRIEQLHPQPACIPAHLSTMIALLEDWADRRFGWLLLLPSFTELIPVLPPNIMDDRAKMGLGLTKEAFVAGAPQAMSQVIVFLARLDALLGKQKFLLGSEFTLADAACYFGLWLMKNSPDLFRQVMAKYPAVTAWFDRIEAFGPGDMKTMTYADAFRIARESEPADLDGGVECVEALGMAAEIRRGSKVSVVADDYGREEVGGKLVRITGEEVTVLRQDSDLGNIAVHFPRVGYRITPH